MAVLISNNQPSHTLTRTHAHAHTHTGVHPGLLRFRFYHFLRNYFIFPIFECISSFSLPCLLLSIRVNQTVNM